MEWIFFFCTGLFGRSCRSSGADALRIQVSGTSVSYVTSLSGPHRAQDLCPSRSDVKYCPWVAAPPRHSFELHCEEDSWPLTWVGGRLALRGSSQTRQCLKMAALPQLHAMCHAVCRLLCSRTSWLLKHTPTSYSHTLWSRNEFNTLLSVALWDFPHCWVNFLRIWADFPRCLCALARRARVCLCAGGARAMTSCAFSLLRSVSSIIQGKRGGTCLQEKGCLGPAKYLAWLRHFLLLTSKLNSLECKVKAGLCRPFDLLLSTLTRRHWLQEAGLMLTFSARNERRLFPSFISPSMRNGKRGNCHVMEICRHTRQRKEQPGGKQWALVSRHWTCPIIYTSLTGAILKAVTGGKLFVSKRLARTDSTSARAWVINDFWPHCEEVAN